MPNGQQWKAISPMATRPIKPRFALSRGFFSFALVIVTLLVLTGCATTALYKFSPYPGGRAELDVAKRAIVASLKDPESARFGSATFYQNDTLGKKLVCIYVNAKNSFGGYTGMQPATVELRDGQAVRVSMDSIATMPCEVRGRTAER